MAFCLFYFLWVGTTALLLWVSAVKGLNLVLDGLVGWTREYVSHMVGAASRIKPFHADDDMLVLRALIFSGPFYFRYSARGIVSFLRFGPSLLPPLILGNHSTFPTYLEGWGNTWAARISQCDPSLYWALDENLNRGGKMDRPISVLIADGFFLPRF